MSTRNRTRTPRIDAAVAALRYLWLDDDLLMLDRVAPVSAVWPNVLHAALDFPLAVFLAPAADVAAEDPPDVAERLLEPDAVPPLSTIDAAAAVRDSLRLLHGCHRKHLVALRALRVVTARKHRCSELLDRHGFAARALPLLLCHAARGLALSGSGVRAAALAAATQQARTDALSVLLNISLLSPDWRAEVHDFEGVEQLLIEVAASPGAEAEHSEIAIVMLSNRLSDAGVRLAHLVDRGFVGACLDTASRPDASPGVVWSCIWGLRVVSQHKHFPSLSLALSPAVRFLLDAVRRCEPDARADALVALANFAAEDDSGMLAVVLNDAALLRHVLHDTDFDAPMQQINAALRVLGNALKRSTVGDWIAPSDGSPGAIEERRRNHRTCAAAAVAALQRSDATVQRAGLRVLHGAVAAVPEAADCFRDLGALPLVVERIECANAMVLDAALRAVAVLVRCACDAAVQDLLDMRIADAVVRRVGAEMCFESALLALGALRGRCPDDALTAAGNSPHAALLAKALADDALWDAACAARSMRQIHSLVSRAVPPAGRRAAVPAPELDQPQRPQPMPARDESNAVAPPSSFATRAPGATTQRRRGQAALDVYVARASTATEADLRKQFEALVRCGERFSVGHRALLQHLVTRYGYTPDEVQALIQQCMPTATAARRQYWWRSLHFA